MLHTVFHLICSSRWQEAKTDKSASSLTKTSFQWITQL